LSTLVSRSLIKALSSFCSIVDRWRIGTGDDKVYCEGAGYNKIGEVCERAETLEQCEEDK
jgi:hypothetical protein